MCFPFQLSPTRTHICFPRRRRWKYNNSNYNRMIFIHTHAQRTHTYTQYGVCYTARAVGDAAPYTHLFIYICNMYTSKQHAPPRETQWTERAFHNITNKIKRMIKSRLHCFHLFYWTTLFIALKYFPHTLNRQYSTPFISSVARESANLQSPHASRVPHPSVYSLNCMYMKSVFCLVWAMWRDIFQTWGETREIGRVDKYTSVSLS